MKVYQFLELLQQHKDKSLLFAYKKGLLVVPSYHITEIKNVIFKTVDCGGKQNIIGKKHIYSYGKNHQKLAKKNI